jgi:hypothetical protein
MHGELQQRTAALDGLDLAEWVEVAREVVLRAVERREQPRQDWRSGQPLAALVGGERRPGDGSGVGDLPLRLAPLKAQAPDGTAELAGDALAAAGDRLAALLRQPDGRRPVRSYRLILPVSSSLTWAWYWAR